MPDSSLGAEKETLREIVRQRLDALPFTAAEQAGEGVAAHLADCPDWRSALHATVFSSLAGEIDTTPLIRLAQSAGKRLYFPRMIAGRSLEFVHVSDLGSMRARRYGVLEPASGSTAETPSSDGLILVPGMAFDRKGGRLGRGAGYYDRALAGWGRGADRPQFVGVCFAIQLVDSVPLTSLDVRMDRVLTEDGFCPSF